MEQSMEQGRGRFLRLLWLGALTSAAAVALSLSAGSAWASEDDSRGILGGAIASLSQTTDALTHEVAHVTGGATGALSGIVSGAVTPVVEHVAPPALSGAVVPVVGQVDSLITGSVSTVNDILASTVSGAVGVVGTVDTTVGGVVGGLAPGVETIVPPVIEAPETSIPLDEVPGDIDSLLSNEAGAPLESPTKLDLEASWPSDAFVASDGTEPAALPATPDRSPFGVPAAPSGAPAASSSAGHDGQRAVAVGSDVGIAVPGLKAGAAVASNDALPPSLSYGTDSPPD